MPAGYYYCARVMLISKDLKMKYKILGVDYAIKPRALQIHYILASEESAIDRYLLINAKKLKCVMLDLNDDALAQIEIMPSDTI